MSTTSSEGRQGLQSSRGNPGTALLYGYIEAKLLELPLYNPADAFADLRAAAADLSGSGSGHEASPQASQEWWCRRSIADADVADASPGALGPVAASGPVDSRFGGLGPSCSQDPRCPSAPADGVVDTCGGGTCPAARSENPCGEGSLPPKQTHTFRVCTVNSTSWGSFKTWITAFDDQAKRPHIIMGQEHRLRHQHDLDEAAAYLHDIGYVSVWTPASVGAGGKPAGGTMLAAVPELGLHRPQVPGHEQWSARLTTGRVSIPGLGRLLVISCYGDQHGLKGDNPNMLSTLPRLAAATGLPLLAGGDYNLEPSQVRKTGILKKAGMEILSPSRSTCITNSWRTASTIDFFVASAGFHQAVREPYALLNQGLATHRPVIMDFVSSVDPTFFYTLRLPTRLPMESPVGPAPLATPLWTKTIQLVESAIAKAAQAAQRQVPYQTARHAQDAAYKALAESAEQELAQHYQLDPDDKAKLIQSKARRGKGPSYQRVRVSLASVSHHPKPRPTTAVLRRMQELVRLMLGHARQSIRSQPPLLDGMSVAQLLPRINDLLDHMAASKTTDLGIDARRPLEHALAIGRALHQGRGKDNWPAVRTRALAKIRSAAEMAESVVRKQRKDDIAASARSWRSWAKAASLRGAGRAHRWTKIPTKGKPSTMLDEEGEDTSRPTDHLRIIAAKYTGLWKPTKEQVELTAVPFPELLPATSTTTPTTTPTYTPTSADATNRGGKANADDLTDSSCKNPQHQPVCPVTVTSLRAAARSFTTTTAQTYDGFHCRHWSLLQDSSLMIVARFVLLCLAMGTMPTQVLTTVGKLLGKAKGGYRTVGLMTSLYRLTVKQQRPSLREWEAHYSHPAFSFQAGKNSLHQVWAQSAAAEYATTETDLPSTQKTAMVLWDLSDYYENLHRDKLERRQEEVGFPMAIAILARQQYGGPRLLQMGSMIANCQHPSRGVIAGCGVATYNVQAYSGPGLSEFATYHPTLALNVHVDDFLYAATGQSDTAVARQIKAGADDMYHFITNELDCTVSAPKAVVIASSYKLQARIAKTLGALGGSGLEVTTGNLGIDTSAGRPRRTFYSRAVLKQRINKQGQRMPRARRLGKGNRSTAGKVYSHGILPGSTYGAQVWGLDGPAVTRLQRQWLQARCSSGKGKSRSRSLLLHGDPTWAPATAPLATYIDLAWAAAMGHPGLPSLPTLRQWWARTPSPPRTWGHVRGPMGAMRKVLAKLGWQSQMFLTFCDLEGVEHKVLEAGPKLMKSLIKRDWHAHLARHALRSFVSTHTAGLAAGPAGSRGDRGGNFSTRPALQEALSAAPFVDLEAGDRLDMYHAISLLKSRAHSLEEDDRHTIETFLLDGFWTKCRLHDAGYLVDDTSCPLCHAAEDTLEHRLFHCQHGDLEDLRQKHLQPRIRSWLDGIGKARHDPENRNREEAARALAKRGLARHPGLHQPPPAEDGADYHGDTDLAFASGVAFSDGSCTKPFHPALARAAWAAGTIDRDGNIIGVAHGPVWRSLPQTSPTAEVVGMAAVVQLVPPGTQDLTMHIDNSMVVRALNHPPPHRHLHRSFHAGVLRTARANPGWKTMAGKARHIKSHAFDDRPDELAQLPPDEQHKYKGNMMVDAEADAANTMWHPPLIKDLLAIDHLAFRAAVAVCRLAAVVLPQFPVLRHQGLYRRRPPSPPVEETAKHEERMRQFEARLLQLDDLAYGASPPALHSSASSPPPHADDDAKHADELLRIRGQVLEGNHIGPQTEGTHEIRS